MRRTGILVAALALAAVSAGCDGDSGEAPTPSAPQTVTVATETVTADVPGPRLRQPPGFPNGGEATLLEGLDPERREWCTRESPRNRARGSRAGIYCDLREPDGARLYLDLFPAAAAVRTTYERYRVGRNVPQGRGRCAPAAGDGPGTRVGESRWERGRVMCFRYRGEFWLVFSNDRRRTLGFVVARSDGPVREFFRSRAVRP